MRIALALVLSVCVLATTVHSMADDTLATLGAGGLIPTRSSEIAMESENLQISIHRITVTYVFRNLSDHAVNATVAFPLPAIDGRMVAISPMSIPSNNPINFLSFKVAVNGRAVSPNAEVRAFMDGKNISGKLRALGFPLSVLDRTLGSRIAKLDEAQQKKLETEGLVVDLDAGDSTASGHPTPHSFWGLWQTQVEFFWQQYFPAHGSVRVWHTYKPVVGGGSIVKGATDDGEEYAQSFCFGAETLNKIAELKAMIPVRREDAPVVWEREIQFVLRTANNWSGPIRKFHLSVMLDHPDDVLSTCALGLRRTSSVEYEVRRTNFRPQSDLRLAIFQANRGSEHWMLYPER